VKKHLVGTGTLRNVYKTLFTKPYGKRVPYRPRKRWENIMRAGFKQRNGCGLRLDHDGAR
jgi:hypothetical protein